jgi:hypothetical protein
MFLYREHYEAEAEILPVPRAMDVPSGTPGFARQPESPLGERRLNLPERYRDTRESISDVIKEVGYSLIRAQRKESLSYCAQQTVILAEKSPRHGRMFLLPPNLGQAYYCDSFRR